MITSIGPGVLKFAGIDVQLAGPAEASHQVADGPQDVQVQEDIKIEAILGAIRASPKKVAAKAWASALTMVASRIETQKVTMASICRV